MGAFFYIYTIIAKYHVLSLPLAVSNISYSVILSTAKQLVDLVAWDYSYCDRICSGCSVMVARGLSVPDSGLQSGGAGSSPVARSNYLSVLPEIKLSQRIFRKK